MKCPICGRQNNDDWPVTDSRGAVVPGGCQSCWEDEVDATGGYMKERPILFSGEMVCAILDGRKTQTRRVIKPQPNTVTTGQISMGPNWMAWGKDGVVKDLWCPYGRTGDRLWVRETWSPWADEGTRIAMQKIEPAVYRADYVAGCGSSIVGGSEKWCPSIHMPRSASRINLEITNTRVELLQDISEDAARAEGISNPIGSLALNIFPSLWDSINLKRGYGWDANPWVWVVEFQRVP